MLACPADVAAKLWPDAPGPVLDHLTSMTYARIDYVYLKTRQPITNNAVGKAAWKPEIEASYYDDQSDLDAMVAGAAALLEIARQSPLKDMSPDRAYRFGL